MNHRIRTRVDVLGAWCASTVVLVFTSHQVVESASRLHTVLRAAFVHDGDAAVVVVHVQLVVAQVVLHNFVGCRLVVCLVGTHTDVDGVIHDVIADEMLNHGRQAICHFLIFFLVHLLPCRQCACINQLLNSVVGWNKYGVVEGVSRGNHFEYKIDYLSIPEGAKKSSEPCYKVIKGDTVVVKVFDKWPYSTTVVEVKQRSFK